MPLLLIYLLLPLTIRMSEPVNGWKDKPRGALVEKYSRTGIERLERLIDRTFYYTDERLDSVVDIDNESKHVMSKFQRVQSASMLYSRDVPWDLSLIATHTTWWKLKDDGGWRLAGITIDSVDPRFHEIADHTVLKINEDGRSSVEMRETSEFNEKGYEILSKTEIGSFSKSATNKSYDFDEQERLTRVIAVNSNDRRSTRGFDATDTTEQSYYYYEGDSDLPELRSVISFLDRPAFIYAKVLQWADSVAEFSSFDFFSASIFLIPRHYILRAEISYDEQTPKLFFASLDDRHRVIRAGYSDSNFTTASYYDDNEVRLLESRTDGMLTFGKKNSRTYDAQGRVITQEMQQLMSAKKDGTYRLKERITYRY